MMTPADVARWMAQEIERDGLLYQSETAYSIAEKFGEEFTYTNNNGSIAISRNVLSAFRELTEKSVVWERGQRLWRKREDYDDKVRRLVE
jgi:hypothetical protein